MNSLDSRYLRVGDTFAHRFTTPGTHRYALGAPGALGEPGHHAAFAISVAEEAGTAPGTHYVTVVFANGVFAAEPAELAIKRNDVVMWSTQSESTAGFSVQGGEGRARFDSACLPANSMYSHAFGGTGVFEWTSIVDPKLCGTVTVQPHPPCRTPAEQEAFMSSLAQPTLVMIDGLKAHPKKVSITFGQTVFFAVRSGGDVAIVDSVLQGIDWAALNPQPLPPKEGGAVAE